MPTTAHARLLFWRQSTFTVSIPPPARPQSLPPLWNLVPRNTSEMAYHRLGNYVANAGPSVSVTGVPRIRLLEAEGRDDGKPWTLFTCTYGPLHHTCMPRLQIYTQTQSTSHHSSAVQLTFSPQPAAVKLSTLPVKAYRLVSTTLFTHSPTRSLLQNTSKAPALAGCLDAPATRKSICHLCAHPSPQSLSCLDNAASVGSCASAGNDVRP